MVARFGEPPAQVVCCQVVFRVAAVGAAGGTMYDDKIDVSHEAFIPADSLHSPPAPPI